jgi:biopolymer transport protein TolQ
MGEEQATTSILSMVFSSGPVVLGVLIILISLSFFSWAIAVAKYLELTRAAKESKEFADIFWNNSKDLSKLEVAVNKLKASPLCELFLRGYAELERAIKDAKGGDSVILERVERTLERAAMDELRKLERGVTFLATVASAAPFIGLFGTVWGIVNAFQGLSLVKSSTLQAVAPGISEALVATAVGLAAAIPASVAYNYTVVSVRRFKESMYRFAAEFVVVAKEAINP